MIFWKEVTRKWA